MMRRLILKIRNLIVWKQTINKSKELKQAVILVTDDRKRRLVGKI